jgi:hypothetical protein
VTPYEVQWTAIVVVLTFALVQFVGCGASAVATRAEGAHEVLNTVTDIADPSYKLAVSVCNAQEQVIVARTGTTLEEDQAAIAEIREKCDIVFHGFTVLRALQTEARATIEAVRENPTDAAYAAAMLIIGRVTEQWKTIKALLEEHGLIEETPQ